MSRKRPWLAAALALLYPGLGHLYLRAWLRAIVWFLLALMTAGLVMPESVATAESLDAMWTAMQNVPITTLAPLLVVSGLCALDAYVSARRDVAYGSGTAQGAPDAGAADGEPTCPACGKELDEELDFCPWCTTRLEWEDEATSR